MDLYFQGAWLGSTRVTRLPPENVAQAHICFDRALIADPSNVAEALIGSARADAVEGINLFVARSRRSPRQAAEAENSIKALSSVPDHPRGHMWLGLVDIWTKRAAEGITPNVNIRLS